MAAVNTVLSLHTWGWIWVGVGIFLATGVPTARDQVQYAVAAAFKAVWGALYLYLWMQGVPNAWISSGIFLPFALIVLLVSSWPELPLRVLGDREGARE